jgi:hypothetical protein
VVNTSFFAVTICGTGCRFAGEKLCEPGILLRLLARAPQHRMGSDHQNASQALTAARRLASTCGSFPAAASAGSFAHVTLPCFRASALVAASVAVVLKRSRRMGLGAMPDVLLEVLKIS